MCLPLFIIEEVLFRGFSELSEQGFCKVVRLHVCKSVVIDSVVFMAGTQKPEKVDSALAVRAFKPGKQVIAHVGAVAIFSVVTGTGIIDVYKRGDLEGYREDVILFFVEAIFVLDKDRAQVTRRNLETPFPQLFEQEGLRDMTMIVLIQNEAFQRWGEMALDFRRQFANFVAPIRGLPTFEEIADIVWFDLDALHRVGLVVFQDRSLWNGIRRTEDRLVDLQFPGFLALLVLAPLLGRFLALLLFVLLKLTGPNLRFRLLPFQSGNLIAELLYDFGLLLYESEDPLCKQE